MGFVHKKLLYSWENISSLNLNQNGCYGIFRHDTCIYVGKGDLRERMLAHFNGDNPCITREGPTHWIGIVSGDMHDEEKRLILQHNPICNQRVG